MISAVSSSTSASASVDSHSGTTGAGEDNDRGDGMAPVAAIIERREGVRGLSGVEAATSSSVDWLNCASNAAACSVRCAAL